jgi:selenocysteine lyase/cysteine desulfurase
MLAIRDYERQLSRHFLQQVPRVTGLDLYGIADSERVAERVPTFAVTLPEWSPRELSAALGERGFTTWAGHYYALALIERLNKHETGGMLRIGCVHYNTVAEIDGILAALSEIAATGR